MASESQAEVTKESALKEVIVNELERLESNGKWVWPLFLLCVTPNILNGFHVSSYVFLAPIPKDVWCSIGDFEGTTWSTEEIRNISSSGLTSQGCTVWNWDYSQLSQMTYKEALEFVATQKKPKTIPCRSLHNSHFEYDDRDSSIVPTWDLVCEKANERTSAQAMVSIGKFIGASSFGILSDKYGRKTSFIIAGCFYITGSILTMVSPWYPLFLLGRMLLGSAASGLFYPAFALLTENISIKYRSWMSIAFSASYPIGMLCLALAAYLVHPWRYLQLTLTIPGFLLLLYFYLMWESPRWLIAKGRLVEAYRVVFKKEIDVKVEKKTDEKKGISFLHKLKLSLKEFRGLYGPPKIRRMALTCHFMWCVTSMCYYVTALNADNLAANRYLYVAGTGAVDIPSYILPMILLRYIGRRSAGFTMFSIAGISLLLVLAIPRDNISWLVFFAMLGRFGISGVYSIVTLHTAELFPTEIRNSALGTSSTMSHVGSITAPYIVDMLGYLGWYIPTTICGSAVLLAGLLMLTLPETGNRKLKDHVEDDL